MEPNTERLKHWRSFVCQTPLGILTDLDGTLIPFAMTPEEAKIVPAVAEVLRELVALPGVHVAAVSGRLRDQLESMLGDVQGIFLVAEHGGWTRATGAWQAMTQGDAPALDDVARDLARVAARHPGALIQRGSGSVTLHHRRVRESEKAELGIEATVLLDRWLASHPEFERIDGAQVVEVRPTRLRKSLAVPWMREHCGPKAALLALGDD